MEFKDYYKIFGVLLEVDDKEIKVVYCKLVCKYYLDVNVDVDVENKFKEVVEVYKVFKDVEKCVEYD